MEQEPLFYDDIYEALKYAAKRSGYKDVASTLFPHKDPQAAARYLSDCLNPERPEKLDLEQVMVIMRMARDAGSHVAVRFLCQHCGYSQPDPVAPEDEKARIEREINEGLKQQNLLLNRYLALKGGGAA